VPSISRLTNAAARRAKMAEILSYDFMRNALLGGLLVSIVCGVVGSLVVINRMSFIAGGIAHGAYGGIGIALFLGISPVLGASVFALFLGLLIAYVTLRNTERFDAVIGAIWAFGMALGIIFADLTPGYKSDLMSFLFGSILAINHENLIFIGICGAAFAALTVCFYRQFLAISFDKEFALLRGVNTSVFYYVLVVMASLAVVASIQIVGLILVISLMTIPPFIAEKISKSLGSMMAISCALSALFCAAGLILSFKLNLTSGASIILVASVCFFASSIFSKLRA
jgi:cation ABC transporter, permease protein